MLGDAKQDVCQETGRGTRDSGAEAAAKELRDMLQRAEAKQVAAWVKQQHKGVDSDLAFTASRLEDSLRNSPSISSGHRTNTNNIDGLASTWPRRLSSMRVDGQDLPGMLKSRNKEPRATPSDPRDSYRGPPRVVDSPSGRRQATDFVKRAREAVAAEGLNADVVDYYLLPSSAVGSEDRTVGNWEVFNVLTIDVGMELSEQDKQLICTEYGAGAEGRIDVDILMASLFPEARLYPTDNCGDVDEAGTQVAAPSPAIVDNDGAASADRLGATTKHSSIPSLESFHEASPSECPHSAGEGCGRAHTSGVSRENKHHGQNRDVHDQPHGGADSDAHEVQSYPIASERPSREANPNRDVHTPPVAGGSDRVEDGLTYQQESGCSDPQGRDFSGIGRGSRKDSHETRLEEENARLRSELAMFDLGFFEEVEDLKYSYAKLKREAEKFAKEKVSDLLASLHLPEDGEEPWDRAVDMAHNSVDWREASKQLPAGSPGYPPRGLHASRLAKRWSNITNRNEQAEGPPCEARFIPRNKQGAARIGPGVTESRRVVVTVGTGVVAAHERKLAWELLSGGMASLESLRKYAKRAETSWSGFLSDDQVLYALKDSGYALDVDDVGVLRTGLGMDADGKVDFAEFMNMCEDIASSQEWYVPANTASTVPAPFVSKANLGHENVTTAIANSRLPMAMFLNNGVLLKPETPVCRGPAESLFLGGAAYGDTKFLKAAKTSDEVVAELKDQLSLLDIDRLARSSSRGEGGSVGSAGLMHGKAVSSKFLRRDPMSSGLLSARELGLALEDLGVTLQADEVVTLARQFPPPGERRPGDKRFPRGDHDADKAVGDLDRVVIEYAPLVRLIVDCLAEASGVGHARLSRQSKWYDRMPGLASRLHRYLDDGGIQDGISRTRQRFRDFDIDNEGYLGRREFIRALTLSLSSKSMGGEQPYPGFPLGGLISEAEAEELVDTLDHRRDGRIFWEDFMEFFDGDSDRGGSGGSARRWFQLEGDIGQKLIECMEGQGGALARRSWVNTLLRRFRDADVDHTGVLDKMRFSRCLRAMRAGLSAEEVQRLFATLQDKEGARFGALIDFLRSRNIEWFRAESDIADKIVRAMGSNVPSRRAWLNRIRQRFVNLDAFRVGIMGASDLLQALRDGGCYLTLDEEARLLDALETEDSARCDIEGGVSYRELLSFCARYAGKGNEVQSGLAGRFRKALKSQAKTASDVRRLFERMDADGDGYIGRHDFNVALHRLGLGVIAREEQEALMYALDAEDSGRIRFADFDSFMQEDPWCKSDAELAERFCKGLEEAGGGVPRTILGTLREWFLKADSQMRGTLDRAQFRRTFASLPDTKGLMMDNEFERLWELLDVKDDGRVSYRSLLDFVVKHMSYWTKRLPEVASKLSFLLRQNEYGLKACVENLSRRIDIADNMGTGRLSPLALGRCLRGVGLELTPDDLREMAKAMDIDGDGLIPMGPVLQFLREETRTASRSGRGRLSKANGELDAAFCDAVRSLAREEQPNGRELVNIRGPHPDIGQETISWRKRLRRIFDRRLDLNGDGYLTERDLLIFLPEIGFDADRQGVRMLLRAMNPRKRGLEQASFKDFVGFVTKVGTGRVINAVDHDDAVDETSASKGSSSSTRPELWRQARIDLGLAPPDDMNAPNPITGADAMRVFARLDPQDRGSLPLGKIKAGLQGLGVSVGKITRDMWLELTDSLDQDAHGYIFYQDLVDNLLPSQSGTRGSPFPVRSPTTTRRKRTSTTSGPSPVETSGARRLVSGALDGRSPVHLRREVSERAEQKRSPTRDGLGTNDFIPRCAYPPTYRRDHRDSYARSVSWGDKRDSEVSKTELNAAARARETRGARVLRHKPADEAERRKLADTSRSTGTRDLTIARARVEILEDLEQEYGTEEAGGEAFRAALRREDLTRRGTLSQGELWTALDSVGVRMSLTRVSELFDHFDKTRSGAIDHRRFADFILRNNLDGTMKRLDISTRQALATQAPAAVSLRRQLQERLVRVSEPVMRGMEFKRLLRSIGLKLAPEEVAHLRQRCGDQSGQVNLLALLAYLEPKDFARENEAGPNKVHGGGDIRLPPNTVLKGRAHGRLGRKIKPGNTP